MRWTGGLRILVSIAALTTATSGIAHAQTLAPMAEGRGYVEAVAQSAFGRDIAPQEGRGARDARKGKCEWRGGETLEQLSAAERGHDDLRYESAASWPRLRTGSLPSR